jgi:hypothetical protein
MGIPCLVLNKSSIAIHVENGVDGLIAADEQEYLELLKWMAKDFSAWQSLSDSTFYHIRQKYQIKEITMSTIEFYQQVLTTSPKNITNLPFPKTPLSHVLSGMGHWAELITSNPEKLRNLEIEYALFCEGGLIHYANMTDTDPELNHLIKHLSHLLERR